MSEYPMPDPRIAALAEALVTVVREQAGEPDGPGWPGYVHFGKPRDVAVTLNVNELAAAILDALPPDWCGHEAKAMDHEACHEWHEDDEAEIARLRKALYNCGLAAQSGAQAMSMRRRGGWEKHRYIMETASLALETKP